MPGSASHPRFSRWEKPLMLCLPLCLHTHVYHVPCWQAVCAHTRVCMLENATWGGRGTAEGSGAKDTSQSPRPQLTKHFTALTPRPHCQQERTGLGTTPTNLPGGNAAQERRPARVGLLSSQVGRRGSAKSRDRERRDPQSVMWAVMKRGGGGEPRDRHLDPS